jgi:hypothetical protein
MKKSSMADVDFTFNTSLERVEAERKIREQIADYRRQTVTAKNPNEKRKAAWQVETGPVTPRWTVERTKDGAVSRLVQNHPEPASDDDNPMFRNKRFIVRIDEVCCVAGEHVEPGVEVECFRQTAFSLHNFRGRITREFTV